MQILSKTCARFLCSRSFFVGLLQEIVFFQASQLSVRAHARAHFEIQILLYTRVRALQLSYVLLQDCFICSKMSAEHARTRAPGFYRFLFFLSHSSLIPLRVFYRMSYIFKDPEERRT